MKCITYKFGHGIAPDLIVLCSSNNDTAFTSGDIHAASMRISEFAFKSEMYGCASTAFQLIHMPEYAPISDMACTMINGVCWIEFVCLHGCVAIQLADPVYVIRMCKILRRQRM